MDCFHCFQVSLQPYRLYQSNHVFFPQLRSYIEVLFLSLTSGNSKGIQMIGKKHSWRFFGLQGRKREKTRGQLDTFFCCSVGCCSTCHILSITFRAFYFDESCVSLPGAFVGIHRADLKKKAIQKRAGSLRFAPGRSMPAMCLSDGYDSGAIAVALGKLGIQPAMYTVQAREVAKQHSNPLKLVVKHVTASLRIFHFHEPRVVNLVKR